MSGDLLTSTLDITFTSLLFGTGKIDSCSIYIVSELFPVVHVCAPAHTGGVIPYH